MKKKEHAASELLNFMLQFQFAFSNVDKHVNLLEKYVDNLSLGIATLVSRQLPPELFPSKNSLFALNSISKQLPTNWALTIEAQLDLMPRFYQDTKVSVAVTTHRFLYENGIKLFIHIPIYEVKYQFQLYKVYNLQRLHWISKSESKENNKKIITKKSVLDLPK